MAVSFKHAFTSPKADGVDSTLVQPSNWNAEHTITLAAGKVLGRDTSGAGAVQELPIAIDSSGNVGVGTTSPAQKLDVKGIMQLTNSATPANTSYLYDGGGLLLSSNNSNPMYFYTGASERMRIDSSGNVGIGVNDPATYGTFAVYGGATATSRQVIISPNSNSYNGMLSFLRTGTTVWNLGIDQADSNKFKIANSGTYSLSSGTAITVDGSGNFTAAGNVTAYSDARLKTNVSTIDNALALVEKMRGVRYDRIDSGKAGIGVIAQEMQEVVPEVVHEGEEHLSVAYGNLVGVLIEAVKELSARVKELEAK